MKIRIGTRKSRLALIQSKMVEIAVMSAFAGAETELVEITTSGDRVLDKPLEKLGGKGVFIDAIEQAMLDGKIDIAVHSAKDLPLDLAEGTKICAVLPRADVHDVLVTRKGFELPEYPFIGTSSTRRAEGIKKLLPNSVTRDIRGNVDTRLQKLADGGYDCIILAAAGLTRLGAMNDRRFDFKPLGFDTLVPAPCQGIIAVQSRAGDTAEMLNKISDENTYLCFETERRVLELMNAGCSSPAGAYAAVKGERMILTVTRDQHTILKDSAEIADRFALAERLVSRL